jgi:hypothetical protein
MQLDGFKVRTFINESSNNWRQICGTVALYRRRPHRAVAFNGNKHSLFGSALASFVHNSLLIPRFAANVFFIQFNNDNAAKRWYKGRGRDRINGAIM